MQMNILELLRKKQYVSHETYANFALQKILCETVPLRP